MITNVGNCPLDVGPVKQCRCRAVRKQFSVRDKAPSDLYGVEINGCLQAREDFVWHARPRFRIAWFSFVEEDAPRDAIEQQTARMERIVASRLTEPKSGKVNGSCGDHEARCALLLSGEECAIGQDRSQCQ